jgi:phage tail sheath protein FI
LNTAALVVPDLYVQIVPPSNYLINGQPTNRTGVVGTAAWGPVDQPVIIGDMPTYAINFGAPVARKHDMGTQVATAIQQGASDFRCVRVTDDTDVAATSTGVTTCITFTALYTGSLGNNLTVQIVNGSKAGSFKAIVGVPGSGQPEYYDNITGTGNAFWVALASAINNGNGVLRGKSLLITATAGTGSTAPTAGTTCTFTGGTDGATNPTSADIIGSNASPFSGMYALANQGCGLLLVADMDDSTQWTTIDGVADTNSLYAIQTGPSGDTIANAVTTKQTAGLDSYSSKLLFGDWVLWNDPFNQVERYVSPQGFAAGRLANLSPEQSGLNKTLYGVAGTQTSASANSTYSEAELTVLIQAGIDVITNPGAGGVSMWTLRSGHNSSSNAAIRGDNYTRLTNFLATSFNAGMGVYCGQVINLSLSQNVSATMNAFLLGLYGQGILGPDVDDGGLPFSVICGIGPGTNNPPNRTKLGYFQCDIQVQYQAINEEFIINLQGGQTVTVTRQTTQNGQVIS